MFLCIQNQLPIMQIVFTTSWDCASTGARLQEIWWTLRAIPSFSAAVTQGRTRGKCLTPWKCHEFWSRNSSSLPISLTSSSSRKNSSMSWILNRQCRRACGHIWYLGLALKKKSCNLKALRKETSTCECQAKLLIKLGACLCGTYLQTLISVDVLTWLHLKGVA